MSDLSERLHRRAMTLDALSDPDLPPSTTATAAWKLEARMSMRNAAKDSTEAADEIERLTRELAEERDKAMEEAAKAVEAANVTVFGVQAFRDQAQWNKTEIAALLRALKEKP